jgi:molybdenum cofactor cytidylyltransferase
MKLKAPNSHLVAAIVLAAGQSKRMGYPKLTLKWGNTTIIGKVVEILTASGVNDILVVTGGAHNEVEAALEGQPARTVFNPDFLQGEMLSSLKIGLTALNPEVRAALVVLGDQPQMEEGVVRAVLQAYQDSGDALVVPSYNNRRGHPWLVDRALWGAIQNLNNSKILRDFLHDQEDKIHHVNVNTGTIHQDLDTPAEYDEHKPEQDY